MTIADKIQRLQAAKAAIAAAITGKGGTVAAGDGFEDFAADVASIPSGITPTGNVDIATTSQVDVTNYATAQVVDADLVPGNIKKDVDVLGVVGTFEGGVDLFNYVQSISNTFAHAVLPDELVLNLSSYKGAGQGGTFLRTNPISSTYDNRTKATINFPSPKLSNFGLERVFYQAYGIKEAKITGDLSGVTSYSAFLDYCSNMKAVDIEFDFTSATNANIYTSGGNNTYITDMRFKEATLKVSCNISKLAALNDTSLVSLANSINESAAAATLALHATPKARCSTLMGTVALDPTSTHHVFTKDASGTVTLADFITTTKGWTLA